MKHHALVLHHKVKGILRDKQATMFITMLYDIAHNVV